MKIMEISMGIENNKNDNIVNINQKNNENNENINQK